MSISSQDWTEILDHTRRRVREAGFVDLDERLALDFQHTTEASTDFIHYLQRLVSGLTERSRSGYIKALGALREALEVEGTDQVEGIEVFFDPADARLYGVELMDLEQLDDLSALLSELKSLLAYLERNGLHNG